MVPYSRVLQLPKEYHQSSDFLIPQKASALSVSAENLMPPSRDFPLEIPQVAIVLLSRKQVAD